MPRCGTTVQDQIFTRMRSYAIGCYLRHGGFPRRTLLETVWKVSKRVGSRFSVARSAENCAISPPRAGSWDHETKPVRSFQTVSRRILLGNPYLCARIGIQDRERFRPCPPVLPIEAQAPCNGYK